MYRIYYLDRNVFSNWYSWWELISHININDVAHTINDIWVSYESRINNKGIKYLKKNVYGKSVIVYDEYNRVINLSELREGVEHYNPNLPNESIRKYYRWRGSTDYQYLRYDPVPFTGQNRWRAKAYRYNTHTYRNYFLSVLSYGNEIKLDSKIKVEFYDYHNSLYRDNYLRSNYNNKSWKNQKKRKQWM
jgi:hypothetical protein